MSALISRDSPSGYTIRCLRSVAVSTRLWLDGGQERGRSPLPVRRFGVCCHLLRHGPDRKVIRHPHPYLPKARPVSLPAFMSSRASITSLRMSSGTLRITGRASGISLTPSATRAAIVDMTVSAVIDDKDLHVQPPFPVPVRCLTLTF